MIDFIATVTAYYADAGANRSDGALTAMVVSNQNGCNQLGCRESLQVFQLADSAELISCDS